MVIGLRFFMKKKMKKRICENHIHLYFIPHMTFSSNLLACSYLFTCSVLRCPYKTETESKKQFPAYNAESPMAIPITQYGITFSHVLHLDVVRSQIELKLKVKTEISSCMAIMQNNPLPSLYIQYYHTV